MSQIYDEYKDDDGFLYVTYSGENVSFFPSRRMRGYRIPLQLTRSRPSGCRLSVIWSFSVPTPESNTIPPNRRSSSVLVLTSLRPPLAVFLIDEHAHQRQLPFERLISSLKPLLCEPGPFSLSLIPALTPDMHFTKHIAPYHCI